MKRYSKKQIKKLVNNKTLKTKQRTNITNKKYKGKKNSKNIKKQNYKKTKKLLGSGFLRSAQCAGINLKIRLETKIICKLRHAIKSNFDNNDKKIEKIEKIINRYINKNQLFIKQGINLNKIILKDNKSIDLNGNDNINKLINALSEIPKNNTYYNIQIILTAFCDIKGSTGLAKYVTGNVLLGAITN